MAGSLLMAAGLGGFALVSIAPHAPAAVIAPVAAVIAPGAAAVTQDDLVASSTIGSAQGSVMSREITRLVIDSIQLDTPVSPAPLVDHDGVRTWDVPNSLPAMPRARRARASQATPF